MDDLIKKMEVKIQEYRDNYDILKVSELQLERMRVAGKSKGVSGILDEINDRGEQVLKNTLGSINPRSITSLSPLKSSLSREVMSVLGRAVGPLEEIPVSDYIQDGIRAQKVLTNTMLGVLEHKAIANMMMQKTYVNPRTNRSYRNKRTPFLNGGGNAESYTTDGYLNTFKSTNDLGIEVKSPDEVIKKNRLTSMSRKYIRGYDEKEIQSRYHESNQYSSTYPVNESFNFLIVNLANDSLFRFPAYIDDVNEAISVSWNAISLINRSEDLYVYDRASRTFTLSFYLFSSTKDVVDFNGKNTVTNATISKGFGEEKVGIISKKYMWDGLNFIHSLTRPAYGSGGTYLRSPHCRLTVADLFVDQLAIVESVNITYPPLIWDLTISDGSSGKILPMVSHISLNGILLHDNTPSVTTKFYKGIV